MEGRNAACLPCLVTAFWVQRGYQGKRGTSSAQGLSRYSELGRELLLCWPPRDGHSQTHTYLHACVLG